MRVILSLFSFKIDVSWEECSNLWKYAFLSIFGCCSLFPKVYGQVSERIWTYLIENVSSWFAVGYPIAFISFLVDISGEECSNLRKIFIFKWFLSFGSLFIRNFGQINAWLLLSFADIVKLVFLFSWIIAFFSIILFSK